METCGRENWTDQVDGCSFTREANKAEGATVSNGLAAALAGA